MPVHRLFLASAVAALFSLGSAGCAEEPHPEEVWERGQARWREALDHRGEHDPAAATRALADFKYAYASSVGSDRDGMLIDLGKAAFVAGSIDEARAYAEKMLADIPENWNYGNRIHFGNLVLGRIALVDDDLDGAGRYLLAAGNTPGSPQLNSFGPDMALAKALLERGESHTVIRYLELCTEFWVSDRGRLEDWIALIRAGRTPDFRNLRF